MQRGPKIWGVSVLRYEFWTPAASPCSQSTRSLPAVVSGHSRGRSAVSVCVVPSRSSISPHSLCVFWSLLSHQPLAVSPTVARPGFSQRQPLSPLCPQVHQLANLSCWLLCLLVGAGTGLRLASPQLSHPCSTRQTLVVFMANRPIPVIKNWKTQIDGCPALPSPWGGSTWMGIAQERESNGRFSLTACPCHTPPPPCIAIACATVSSPCTYGWLFLSMAMQVGPLAHELPSSS